MRTAPISGERWLETFAQTVRAARMRAGLSQAAAAKAIGVHFQTVHRWEQGLHAPKLWTIPAIARAYGVPAASLLEESPVSTCVAEVWVSRSTLLDIRREGRAHGLEVAERIARQLEPELWHAATGRLPRKQDTPWRAKPRRSRAEVLAGVKAATEAATRARLRGLSGELERIEAERVDDHDATGPQPG